MMNRNPFSSLKDEPLKREDVEHLRDKVSAYWEDTMLQTRGGVNIITAGNFRAILDALLLHNKVK